MTIPHIHTIHNNNISVPNVTIPNWQVYQPTVDHLVPPVVSVSYTHLTLPTKA